MASTEEVLTHHLTCFGEGDLDGILSDYTDESVLITPVGTLKGVDQIRPLFQGMIEEFGKPGVEFEMTCQTVEGEYGFIVWKAETPDNSYAFGTDTFVIRDGKIIGQSFAAKATPKA